MAADLPRPPRLHHQQSAPATLATCTRVARACEEGVDGFKMAAFPRLRPTCVFLFLATGGMVGGRNKGRVVIVFMFETVRMEVSQELLRITSPLIRHRTTLLLSVGGVGKQVRS